LTRTGLIVERRLAAIVFLQGVSASRLRLQNFRLFNHPLEVG
jgi:hypothetical protein